MKILFVSEYYPPKIMGGGEINLALTAEALVKKGVSVIVLTSSFSWLAKEEEKNGVTIYRRLKTGQNPASFFANLKRKFLLSSSVFREVKKLVLEVNPDIIHFQGASLIAAEKIANLGKPLFATIESYPGLCPKGDRRYKGKEACSYRCSVRRFVSCQKHSSEIGKMKNSWFLKYNPFFLALTYLHYRRLNRSLASCRLVAISSYVRDLLQQQELKSVVIPNIIPPFVSNHIPSIIPSLALGDSKSSDLNYSRPDNYSKLDNYSKQDKLKILYLGTLSQAKGVQILGEILPNLSCRVDFYGEGPLKEWLQQVIIKEHLDAEIHAPVPYEKVASLYLQTDLVVVPSLWPEPFGRIPLEARMVGKTVIASAIGGLKETAGEGVILVAPGDKLELRRAILGAIENKKVETNRKTESRRKKIIGNSAFDNYSEEKITSLLLDYYLS